MRLPHATDLTGVDVALVGVPFDSGTSYRPGTRLGPREIRTQSSLIRPFNHFQQVAPFEQLTVVDAGDVDASPINLDLAHHAIESRIGEIVVAGAVPLAVGGDHSISLPALRAVARTHGPLGLIQFDSHIDTWDEDFGSKLFHGSPFYYAVTEHLVDPRRFVQVGIRGPMYGADDFAFQREHGIAVLDIDEVGRLGIDGVLAQDPVGRRRRARVCDVRHRRGGPGVRARHRHAGSRRPDEPRGAASAARPGGTLHRRRRHRRSLAPVRRTRVRSRPCWPRTCSSRCCASWPGAGNPKGSPYRWLRAPGFRLRAVMPPTASSLEPKAERRRPNAGRRRKPQADHFPMVSYSGATGRTDSPSFDTVTARILIRSFAGSVSVVAPAGMSIA